ncbi:MAG: 30S ribosomal protein S9 [Actinobacteria bacterium]|nr:30S ribosomal protein S9 [Actinomycetota bacterium]
MTEQLIYSGTGRRKTAVARVFLKPGEGKISVNDKDFAAYFKQELLIKQVRLPLVLTGTERSYDINVRVVGGGSHGQAEAVVHGISRALLNIDESYRAVLRKEGLLTRDPRMKERKKYGLKKARKRPQYTKR